MEGNNRAVTKQAQCWIPPLHDVQLPNLSLCSHVLSSFSIVQLLFAKKYASQWPQDTGMGGGRSYNGLPPEEAVLFPLEINKKHSAHWAQTFWLAGLEMKKGVFPSPPQNVRRNQKQWRVGRGKSQEWVGEWWQGFKNIVRTEKFWPFGNALI